MTRFSDRELGFIASQLAVARPANTTLEWYVLANRILSLSIEFTVLARSGRSDETINEALRVATSRLAQMLIEPHVHEGLQERLEPLLLARKVRPQ